nr:unnamed protein product [Digitaria exilis]
MTEDFLLDTEFARRLYHDYAKDQPIFDYHCHLPPQQVAENYRFKNLYDIWLKGDHYKWRAMRTNGVAERLCTGDASDREKFDAWAATVPHTIGNPLYHWTHLELRRPFGITGKLLSPATADEIWDRCNELLAQDTFSARGIMKQMNVKMVGTTDDPIDSLEHHAVVARDTSFDIKVLPSWRPDKAFNIEQATFNDYMAKLAEVSDTDIRRFADLQSALTKRLDHFAAHGCKVSDHALDVVMFAESNEAELDSILARRLSGESLSEHEVAQFKTAVLVFLGAEYARRGWVQQYHIGALRNNNQRQFKLLGADVGFDSINDRPLAEELSKLLSKQNEQNLLPKTILYCLNPRDNEEMICNVDSDRDGRVDFGEFKNMMQGITVWGAYQIRFEGSDASSKTPFAAISLPRQFRHSVLIVPGGGCPSQPPPILHLKAIFSFETEIFESITSPPSSAANLPPHRRRCAHTTGESRCLRHHCLLEILLGISGQSGFWRAVRFTVLETPPPSNDYTAPRLLPARLRRTDCTASTDLPASNLYDYFEQGQSRNIMSSDDIPPAGNGATDAPGRAEPRPSNRSRSAQRAPSPPCEADSRRRAELFPQSAAPPCRAWTPRGLARTPRSLKLLYKPPLTPSSRSPRSSYTETLAPPPSFHAAAANPTLRCRLVAKSLPRIFVSFSLSSFALQRPRKLTGVANSPPCVASRHYCSIPASNPKNRFPVVSSLSQAIRGELWSPLSPSCVVSGEVAAARRCAPPVHREPVNRGSRPVHGSVNGDVSPHQQPAVAVAILQKSPSFFQKSTRVVAEPFEFADDPVPEEQVQQQFSEEGKYNTDHPCYLYTD